MPRIKLSEQTSSKVVEARKHNWNKGLITGMKKQIQRMLETDTKLTSEQRGALKFASLHFKDVLEGWK